MGLFDILGLSDPWYQAPVNQDNPLYAGMSQQEMNDRARFAAQSMQMGFVTWKEARDTYQPSDYDYALEELNRLFPSIETTGVRYVEPLWLRFLRWLARLL